MDVWRGNRSERVTKDSKGDLDEIVMDCASIHMEALSASQMWFSFRRADLEITGTLHTKSQKIRCNNVEVTENDHKRDKPERFWLSGPSWLFPDVPVGTVIAISDQKFTVTDKMGEHVQLTPGHKE